MLGHHSRTSIVIGVRMTSNWDKYGGTLQGKYSYIV